MRRFSDNETPLVICGQPLRKNDEEVNAPGVGRRVLYYIKK